MHKSLAGRRTIEHKARAFRLSKQQGGRSVESQAASAQPAIASKIVRRIIRLKGKVQKNLMVTSHQLVAHVVDRSTLTDRYQTTILEKVRDALHLGKRDKIVYALRKDGVVELRRDEPNETEDPALGRCLALLARDMQSHPGHLQPATRSLYDRMMSAVQGVEVNWNERLPDD